MYITRLICLRLCAHLSLIAAVLAFSSDGIIMDIKRAMMAMTTSTSTRVKPNRSGFFAVLERQTLVLDVLYLIFTS